MCGESGEEGTRRRWADIVYGVWFSMWSLRPILGAAWLNVVRAILLIHFLVESDPVGSVFGEVGLCDSRWNGVWRALIYVDGRRQTAVWNMHESFRHWKHFKRY